MLVLLVLVCCVAPALYLLWKLSTVHLCTQKEKDIPSVGRNAFEAILYIITVFLTEKSLFKWIVAGSLLYGKKGIFKFRMFQTEYVVVSTAETAEPILNNIVHVDRPGEYQLAVDIFGADTLAISESKLWRTRRRVINPAFNKQIIDEYIPTFNEKARDLRDSLLITESREVDFDPLITSATVQAIMETALGQNWEDSLDPGEAELAVESLNTMTKLFNDRILTPWQWITPLYYISPQGWKWKNSNKILNTAVGKMISERKEAIVASRNNDSLDEGQEGGVSMTKKRVSFLDRLLHMHLEDGSIEMKSIEGEVKAFFFAGHDTLTVGLSWALFLLGHYPEVQEKAQAEVDEVLEGKENVDYEEIKDLVYLECVIKEALRLFPPGPVIARKLLHQSANIGSYTVPKGTTIVFNIYGVHRDPKCFPDPERFQPERFLPENSEGRNPYSFLAFSGGPRGCIGQRFAIYEAKIFLAWILREFKVRSVMDQDKVKFTREIVLRSALGMPLVFTKRVK